MSKEIIKSIEINIGDTTVKVTPKQAGELLEALSTLLNAQPQVKIIERHVHHDRQPYVWPWYNQPTISVGGTASDPQWNKWTISYSDKTQNAVMSIQ